jgi:stage IV sporulation protein FB
MRWSFAIGRIGETVIRIHITLLLFLAWFAWGGWQLDGARGAVDQLTFIALLFVSVLLHEFGHIGAARHYGIPTPEVLLTPIGGLARIARMPDSPRQELVVALAGPLVTLLIAVGLAIAVALSEGSYMLRPPMRLQMSLMAALYWTNLILLGFNLLPAFPMDGGRVLRALLASRIGLLRGTRIAARIGQAVAIAFAILGLQSNPMLLLIAAFVFLGAEAEYEAVKTRQLAGDLTAGRLTVTDVRTLRPEARLDDAIRLLTTSDQRAFPVVDAAGHFVGLLTRDDMLRGVAAAGLAGPVSEAMVPPEISGVVPVSMGFELAVQQLFASKREALPVVDQEGRLVGLMTRDNVTDVLLVKQLKQQLQGSV